MAAKPKMWFDAEVDSPRVRCSGVVGFEGEAARDAVLESVRKSGRVIGFRDPGVGRFKHFHPPDTEGVNA